MSTGASKAGRKPRDPNRPTRARGAGRKIDDVPGTVTHRKVAEKLGIATETLRKWVEAGTFPRPHSVFGTILLYREDVIRTFIETGKWPESCQFNGRGGQIVTTPGEQD